MIIGIIGLLLLAVGWASEAIDLIKKKKSRLDLKFAILYTLGSFFLVIYSVQIGDIIFMILNTVVMTLSLISLIFTLGK